MINFAVHPVLLDLGSFKVYTYGFMLAAAFLISLYLMLKNSKKYNISKDSVYEMLAFSVLCSVVFARLFYYFYNQAEFTSFFEILAIWKGGLMSIGALFGGVFGAFIYSKFRKIGFISILDLLAPYFALGVAFGRIGCFIRGCCFGIASNLPWAVLYDKNSFAAQAGFDVSLHPVQLYHSIANFVIFYILYKRQTSKKDKPGRLFLMFLALSSAERFILDFFRYYPAGDMLFFLPISVFQLIYLVLALLSLFLLLKLKN